jgi:hypothetical protein
MAVRFDFVFVAPNKPPTNSAPPAHPFPAGFAADGSPSQQQQQPHSRKSSQQTEQYRPQSVQRQPSQDAWEAQTYTPRQTGANAFSPAPAARPPATAIVTAPPAAAAGGDDMFDLFDGMSLKAATPANDVAPTPAAVAAPAHANGHAHPAADAHAADASSGDDMFSGLTVAAADVAVPSLESTRNGDASSGGSLLNMLNQGGEGDAPSEPSGFSFVTESSTDDAPPADDAGSSFSFMSSGASEDAAPSPAAAPTSSYVSPHAVSAVSAAGSRKSSMASDAASPNHAAIFNQTPTPTNSGSVYSNAFNNHGVVTTPGSSRSSFSGPGLSAPKTNTGTPSSSTRKTINTGGNAAPTFDQIHSGIDECLMQYFDELKNLSLTQSAMRTQQISLQTSLKQIQTDISCLETRQQQEIEAENYDAADELNVQLDQLKSRSSATTAELARSTKDLSAQEEKKQNLRRMTREALEDALKQYGFLTKQHTYQMTNAITSETQLLEQKEDILLTTLEKTRRNLAHTQADIEKVEAEEGKIEEVMVSETREMNSEWEQLQEQLTGLHAERDALRALLAAKEEECAICSQKIDVVVTGIEGKKSSHQKKLARAHEKKTRLRQEQSEAEKTEEGLLQAKAELEADFMRVAAQEKGSTRKLKKMQEEVTYVQGIVTNKLSSPAVTIHDAAANGEDGASTPSASSASDLASLHSRLASTSSQLEKSISSLSTLEANLAASVTVLDGLSTRIPQLESEKNLAVATRDFKKAAQASKDVKALQTQKADLEGELSKVREEAATLNAEVSRLSTLRSELLSQKTQLEADEDKKKLLSFLKARVELNRKMTAVEALQRKNATEKEEEARAKETPASPASVATAAVVNSTAHHFSFLSHERAAYAIEEELLQKEITQLREQHQWDEKYLEEEARTELAAERKARGESPLDEEGSPKSHANSSAAASSAQAGEHHEEEAASISEQRRKDRQAAADAAKREAEGEASGATTEDAAPASSTDATSSHQDAAPTEGTNLSSELPAESTHEDSAHSASAAAADPAPAEPEPAAAEPEPLVPAGPSESEIAEWRSSHAALVSDITTADASLQTAIDAEDFETADQLETELVEKRQQKEAIEIKAREGGVELEQQ